MILVESIKLTFDITFYVHLSIDNLLVESTQLKFDITYYVHFPIENQREISIEVNGMGEMERTHVSETLF